MEIHYEYNILMEDTNEETLKWSRLSRRNWLASISTVAIAGLAGCSGGSSGGPTTTTQKQPTTTTTTKRTTTDTGPSLETVSFPDGASKSAVSGDLLLTHQFEMSGVAFSIDKQYSDRHRSRRTKIQLGTTKAAQRQVSNASSRSFWKTGEVGLCRANGGAYYYHCDPTVDRQRIAEYHRIERHLNLGDYRPTNVEEQDGTVLITAKASSATLSGDLSRRFDTINSYRGTLSFTPDGIIHSLSYEMEAVRPWDDRPEVTSYSWEASKIGETTVTKPSWVSQATEKAFDFEITAQPDEDYVAIEAVSGSGTLPSNLHVSFNSREYNYDADPEIALTKGDILYIAPLNSGSLGVTTGEPPTDRATVSGSFNLRLYVNGITVIETSVSL